MSPVIDHVWTPDHCCLPIFGLDDSLPQKTWRELKETTPAPQDPKQNAENKNARCRLKVCVCLQRNK